VEQRMGDRQQPTTSMAFGEQPPAWEQRSSNELSFPQDSAPPKVATWTRDLASVVQTVEVPAERLMGV
jgi:hypothetical protein